MAVGTAIGIVLMLLDPPGGVVRKRLMNPHKEKVTPPAVKRIICAMPLMTWPRLPHEKGRRQSC